MPMHTDTNNDWSTWLQKYRFSYFITIKSIHECPFSKKQIEKRLSKINFATNKHFLKSSWSKWDIENRFWMFVVKETTRGDHFHALLYSPSVIHKNLENFEHLPRFLVDQWNALPTLVEQKYTKSGECPFYIEPIGNSEHAVSYLMKEQWKPELRNQLFFV